MLRSRLPIVLAYLLAVLPFASVAAGQTLLENLANPIEPLSEQNWDFRLTAFEVFALVYLVGIVFTLPFFVGFRWLASKSGWLNYGMAALMGALTSLLALLTFLFMMSGGLDNELLEVSLFSPE